MEQLLDLVGIGECLVEFSEQPGGSYALDYSGDVLNSLSYASKLGLRTGIVSAFGDDLFTTGLIERLSGLTIEYSHAPVVPGAANGVYFVQLANGKPQFHFLRKHSAATQSMKLQSKTVLIEYINTARALLLSSIPFAVMEGLEEMIALGGISLMTYFDINARPSLWLERNDLRALVERSSRYFDVLLLTDDDDTYLFGSRRVPEEIFASYTSFGWRRIILRRGALPTLAFWNGDLFEVPVSQNLMIRDTTGAGDAFNAGFIARYLQTNNVKDALIFGNAVAGHSTEFTGGRAKNVSLDRVAEFERSIRDRMEEMK